MPTSPPAVGQKTVPENQLDGETFQEEKRVVEIGVAPSLVVAE
jgi:hypothetical protein